MGLKLRGSERLRRRNARELPTKGKYTRGAALGVARTDLVTRYV